MHWHQVATAIRAGLEGGYYTLCERPAPLETFHFYAWGPFPYLMYAIPGSLFGWGPYSLPVFNLTALTLALTFFCWAARLSRLQLVMLALILLTFWPGLLQYPLSMLETLHYALAVMLAALCVMLWQKGGGSLTCSEVWGAGLYRLYFNLAALLGDRPPTLPTADASSQPQDDPAVRDSGDYGGVGIDDLL